MWKLWKVMKKSWKSHEKVMTKSWEGHKSVIRQSWEIHEKVLRRCWESQERIMRESCKNHEKIMRKSWEIHDKVKYIYFHWFGPLGWAIHRASTAKPTERQKSLTILADSLEMQSVSWQFEFLWKSVQVPCLLTQSKHPDWLLMFACQPANTAISHQQSAIRERKQNKFRTNGLCSKVVHRSSCPV